MLTAEAEVETERASRYLVQLCRHVSCIPAHRGGKAAACRGVIAGPERGARIGRWTAGGELTDTTVGGQG